MRPRLLLLERLLKRAVQGPTKEQPREALLNQQVWDPEYGVLKNIKLLLFFSF